MFFVFLEIFLTGEASNAESLYFYKTIWSRIQIINSHWFDFLENHMLNRKSKKFKKESQALTDSKPEIILCFIIELPSYSKSLARLTDFTIVITTITISQMPRITLPTKFFLFRLYLNLKCYHDSWFNLSIHSLWIAERGQEKRLQSSSNSLWIHGHRTRPLKHICQDRIHLDLISLIS